MFGNLLTIMGVYAEASAIVSTPQIQSLTKTGGFTEVNPATGYGKTHIARGTPVVVVGSAAGPAIYDMSGTNVVNRPFASGSYPSYATNGTSISPDGVYVAIVTSGGPQGLIFKWDGTNYNSLGNISGISTAYGTGCQFHPSGNFIVFCKHSSLELYSRSGDTFTFVSSTTTGVSQPENCYWSPDGTKLAVSERGQLNVYSFNGSNAFSRIYNLSVGGWACNWSRDGTLVYNSGEIVSTGLTIHSIGSSSGSLVQTIDSSTQVNTVMPFTLNNVSYIMYSSTGTADTRVQTRGSGDLHAITTTPSALGLNPSNAGGEYNDSAIMPNGKQYIVRTVTTGNINLQMWRIN